MRHLLSLVLCMFVFVCSQARIDNKAYWKLDVESGLSHSNVTDVCTDSQGMLWVGTVYGLNCYDYYQIRTYFHEYGDPFSLPGSRIYFVTEDAYGTIWVSTDGGLATYDREKNRFTPLLPDAPLFVSVFHKTGERILLGGSSLYCYTFKDKKISEIPLGNVCADPSRIVGIHQWSKDVCLLVMSNGRIIEYNERKKECRDAGFGQPENRVIASYLDSLKNLYLSVYHGGIVVYGSDGKMKKLPDSHHAVPANTTVLDFEEKDGTLWAATDGDGIYVLDLADFHWTTRLRHLPEDPNSLPANSITCLYKDALQNIWAGSVRDGVLKISQTFSRAYTEVPFGSRYGLSNKTILSICQDAHGMIWIGTDGGGLNLYHPEEDVFTHFPSTRRQKVVSIAEYSADMLLISCYDDGIYLFNKKTGKCTPFVIVDPKINEQMCKEGYLVLVYRASAGRFLFLAGSPYIYDREHGKFSLLRSGEDGETLIGLQLVSVDGDVAFFQQKNKILKADLADHTLSVFYRITDGEQVEVVSRDDQGLFWIGTDHGLRRLDPVTQRYEKIETNLFKRVSAIQTDHNNQLWIGAQNMLFSYDTRLKTFFILGGPNDYFPNELSTIYAPPSYKEYIYLGGIHGLLRINKKVVQASDSIEIRLADIVLDGVSLGKDRQAETGVQIPWNYKSFQLKIRNAERDINRKYIYRYMVNHNHERIDIESYDPVLSMPLLASGNYSVSVSFYTLNGVWSEPVRLLEFDVMPPWYRDARIRGLLLLILVAFLYWRIAAMLKKKEAKAQKKMEEVLESTSQEKVHFLLNVSHELRTPLTLIYSPLHKLLEKLEQPEMGGDERKELRTQLISVHRAADRMKSIINMTLDISKIDSEEYKLQLMPHAVNEWIYAVAEGFKYEVEDKSMELDFRLEELPSPLRFDDRKCEIILSNLLMNALKFSPVGGRIAISTMRHDGYLRISVADQGPGLGDIHPEKLFAWFYQGAHTKGGTGVGLAYSKVLVEKHGGTIGACNNADGGATFYFELPLLVQEDEVEKRIPEVPPFFSSPLSIETDGHTELNLAEYSILIVEDNRELCEFLEKALRDDYKAVLTAYDGEQAWEVLSQQAVDLVISDVMMPHVGGYELCRRIKSDELSSHIPVVLLTALGDTNSMGTGYRMGADAYVSKPFDMEVLQQMLRSQLWNRELLKKQYREKFIRVAPAGSAGGMTPDELFLEKLNQLILDNLSSGELNVTFLTQEMGISRTPLYAKLKGLTNLGVNDYINRMRIEKSVELLLHSSLPISEISERVGFEYHRYFSTLFKQVKGMSPRQFRQEGKIS